MSNLVDHARRELARLGNDKEFDRAILASVAAFASYGHSGSSATYGVHILSDLLQFKNVSPLTEDPDEWIEVARDDGVVLCQSTRNPAAFSHDGGYTYYVVGNGTDSSNPYPLYKTNPKVEEGAEAQDQQDVRGA